jgi:hypothetical protein
MNDETTELDKATSRRLSRLASMPVETSRLDAALKAALPLNANVVTGARSAPWLLRLRAIAAAVLIVVTTWVVILAMGSRPVMASPGEIARWHYDMIGSCGAVTSITDANRALHDCDEQSPALPAPPGEIRACCLKMMGKQHVSCAMIERKGEKVMICIAAQGDIKAPQGQKMSVGGLSFEAFTDGQLNIVSTHRDGRWVCASGNLSHQELAETAAMLKF